jgi:hypothetical protein
VSIYSPPREPAKASTDMSVCFARAVAWPIAPRQWLVIVLVVLAAIFEAHPDGEPPGNYWLRLSALRLRSRYSTCVQPDTPRARPSCSTLRQICWHQV